MAKTRIKFNLGDPFRAVLSEWADKDGAQRAERVAAVMRAESGDEDYVAGIEVFRDEHPERPSFHIGSTYEKAPFIEAATGNAVRALDAAR